MDEPICRFCLDSANESHNPLISPCPCKGSVKHIHLACFNHWVLLDFPHLNLTCSICKVAFNAQCLPPLEYIPTKGTIHDFLLNSSFTLLFAIQYACLFMMSTGPILTNFIYTK